MSFTAALAFVLEHEGVYSNRPDDPGGETVCGIARRYHPEWSGWPMVDAITARGVSGGALRGEILTSAPLDDAVAEFYRANYWQPVGLDELPEGMAVCLFDSFVNGGLGSGAQWAQKSVNLLHGNPRLVVDGRYGPASRAAVAEIAAVPSMRMPFCSGLLLFRMFHYGTRQHAATFINGWSRRVQDLLDYAAAMTRRD